MESGAAIKDLKVQVTNRQILSIALPITFAILILHSLISPPSVMDVVLRTFVVDRVAERALGPRSFSNLIAFGLQLSTRVPRNVKLS